MAGPEVLICILAGAAIVLAIFAGFWAGRLSVIRRMRDDAGLSPTGAADEPSESRTPETGDNVLRYPERTSQ